MFMMGGIDGFFYQRYSLPIQAHLVACANTEFVHNRFDRVRFAPTSANNYAELPPKTERKTSNKQQLSALEAGLTEAL